MPRNGGVLRAYDFAISLLQLANDGGRLWFTQEEDEGEGKDLLDRIKKNNGLSRDQRVYSDGGFSKKKHSGRNAGAMYSISFADTAQARK
jgi:hypothetical protein